MIDLFPGFNWIRVEDTAKGLLVPQALLDTDPQLKSGKEGIQMELHLSAFSLRRAVSLTCPQ